MRMGAAILGMVMALSGPPKPEETLKWMKKLPSLRGWKSHPYASLSVGDLKTLKKFAYGGHTASGPHVATPAPEFRYLTGLPALEELDLLENDGVDDSALVHIGKIGSLTSLDFGGGGARVTGAGLKHVRGLKGLVFLGMAGNKGEIDAGMTFVASLPNLQVLVLSNTRVTDAGLARLAKAPRLREVQVAMNSRITDRGLLALRSNRSLKKIIVDRKAKVSARGIARLKRSLPECAVVRR